MIFKLLYTAVLLFIPGYLEDILKYTKNAGNMGQYGMYYEVYRNRNILYLSIVLFGISRINSYNMLGFLILAGAIHSYIHVCYKWLPLFFYDTIQ